MCPAMEMETDVCRGARLMKIQLLVTVEQSYEVTAETIDQAKDQITKLWEKEFNLPLSDDQIQIMNTNEEVQG